MQNLFQTSRKGKTMARLRRDTKGRVLQKGETYLKDRQLYLFTYIAPNGDRRYVYSKSLEELREKKRRIEFDRLDGLDYAAYAKSTINYVFDRYMEKKTELRNSTRTNYMYTYNRYVRNGFGKRKIADVRYSDVYLFYKSLMEEYSLSASSINMINCVLAPTFQMAVRDQIIRNNPADDVMSEIRKKMEGDPEIRHALTLEEERAFLKFLDEPANVRWKPLFTVMLGTGMRVGEVIALRWVDLNYWKNEIRVKHSITYCPRHDKDFKCEHRITAPKTEAGIRTIPMLDAVRDAFKEEWEIQKTKGACTAELDGISGFVFCNRFGGLLNLRSINRVIKRIVSDYNAREEVSAARERRRPILIPVFSCHVTRHTFCTRLCENETNIKVIQTIMGHKNVQTTLDIYAEVTERKKQEVFRELNNQDVL